MAVENFERLIYNFLPGRVVNQVRLASIDHCIVALFILRVCLQHYRPINFIAS